MAEAADHLFVITGGPGAGKSALIDALRRAGLGTADEVGRSIIRQQAAIGGRALPWTDPPLFAEMMLSWEIESYRVHSAQAGPVFFDRGVPDVIGYLSLLGLPVPGHMTKAADLCRYHRRVLVAPPWPEIFRQDGERRQTLDEAERTYEAMVRTYAGFGYELVEIPRAPVEDRVRFVVAESSAR